MNIPNIFRLISKITKKIFNPVQNVIAFENEENIYRPVCRLHIYHYIHTKTTTEKKCESVTKFVIIFLCQLFLL